VRNLFRRLFCCSSWSTTNPRSRYDMIQSVQSPATYGACPPAAVSQSIRTSVSSASSTGSPPGNVAECFVGHYILLVGYDPEQDIFTYRDPGTDTELCYIEGGELEKARNSLGTDHDVIVVRTSS